jgi:hypothetical protein
MRNMSRLRNYLSKYAPILATLVLCIAIAGGIVSYAPNSSKLAPSTVHASGSNITGFAWSDNIGWVCFDDATYCSTSNVTADTTTGALSGYAWSENIGWINFGPNSCGTQATLSGGALTGWAQAVANGSGWDGCISLSGSSPAYGVTLSSGAFNGYAWGSDVVGWLSFNCATGGPTGNNICATSNYKVSYAGASPSCTLSAAPNPAATNSSFTLNYTTTNNPTAGTIKDSSNNTITASATNASGGVAATSPASAGSYTYTMNVSNLGGSASCQATLTTGTDICTDIPGLQTSLPTGCAGPTPSPVGSCISTGYQYNGSQCVPQPLSISNFTGPTRVRSGSTAVLKYTVIQPSGSCDITGTNGYDSGPFTPVNAIPGSVTTNPITANTKFTLTCSGVSNSIDVGVTPVFQEQ